MRAFPISFTQEANERGSPPAIKTELFNAKCPVESWDTVRWLARPFSEGIPNTLLVVRKDCPIPMP